VGENLMVFTGKVVSKLKRYRRHVNVVDEEKRYYRYQLSDGHTFWSYNNELNLRDEVEVVIDERTRKMIGYRMLKRQDDQC
jgi:hypothetical protein